MEYLLSERNAALNEIVYFSMERANNPKYGVLIGKVQMIDAFLNLPEIVQLKLKEEQV